MSCRPDAPAHGWDPRDHGADCDRCAIKAILKDKWNPVPIYRPRGNSGVIVASDHPGGVELEEGEPLCGNSGQLLAEHLRRARDRVRDEATPVHPGEIAKTNAILCEIPERSNGKLNVLKAQIRKSNRTRKKEGRPLLRMPEECCRPRLMAELRDYPNVVVAGNAIVQSILQTGKTITALRGGPVYARLNDDDSIDVLDEETWTRLNEAGVGRAEGPLPGRGFQTRPPARVKKGQLLRILPTFNPALVFHQKRHKVTLQADIDKAVRWFRTGHLRWKRPHVKIAPTPAELRAFFRDPARMTLPSGRVVPFVSFDLETTKEDPLYARFNCIGFGTLDRAVVIPLASINDVKPTQAEMWEARWQPGDWQLGDSRAKLQALLERQNGAQYRTRFYSDEQEAEIIEIITKALLDSELLKVGWNSRAFDVTALRARLGITPKWHVDLIIAHKLTASELPHGLGYVASVELDVGAWKADHSGTEATSDEEQHLYNGTDDVVTAQLAPVLLPKVFERDQWSLLAPDMRTQDLARGIHENGVFVDQKERRRLERFYRHESDHFRRLCHTIVGREFNPGSTVQIADILYNKANWGLKEIDFTEMGAARVDDTVMRAHFLDKSISAERRQFFDAVRRYRRAMKYLGTYITKLRPNTEHTESEFAEWDEEILQIADDSEREAMLQEIRATGWRPGVIGPDGRYHFDIKAYVAVSGRLASAVQSMPRRLRSCIVPGAGRRFVYADMDQLELRLAAILWGAKGYIEVFLNKQDAHALTADMLYGEEWRRAIKGSEEWERMRDFAKRFAYAVLYGAHDDTVHDVIVAVENDAGVLIYADLPLRETIKRRKAWLDANPEIVDGWEHETKTFRSQGFLMDPIVGRRRDFLDGDNLNELYNFRVQAGGSAIVRKGCFDLMEQYPHQYAGHGTGFVGEFHDAVILEVPEEQAEKARQDVGAAMNRRELGMDFTSKAKVLTRFGDPYKAAA